MNISTWNDQYITRTVAVDRKEVASLASAMAALDKKVGGKFAGTLKIQGEQGRLTVYFASLGREFVLRKQVGAKQKDALVGKALVSVREFHDIVGRMKDREIVFSFDEEDRLTISSGPFSKVLDSVTDEAVDPEEAQLSGPGFDSVTLDRSALQRALKPHLEIALKAAKSDSRSIFSSIHLEWPDKDLPLTWASTDGMRMFVSHSRPKSIRVEPETQTWFRDQVYLDKRGLALPAALLEFALKVSRGEDLTIFHGADNNTDLPDGETAIISWDGGHLWLKSSEGRYPNWSKVMPDSSNFQTNATFDRTELLGALENMRPWADISPTTKKPLLLLKSSGWDCLEKLGITNEEEGPKVGIKPKRVDGEHLEIYLDADYLIHHLKTINTSFDVRLRYQSEVKSMVVESEMGNYVIMPVKRREKGTENA